MAQDPGNTPDCSSATKLSRPKSNRIVSAGVINGKAIDLVKPEYPASARHLRVRGSVRVSVLIDQHGCVSEAKAVSGHPVLLQASLRAALNSVFSPIPRRDRPIWIYGIIVYNYGSDTLNWLELGFASDSPGKLIDYLPREFDRQRNELKSAILLRYDEYQKSLAVILAAIRIELAPNPKHQWLFDVGQKLKAISRYEWVGPDGREESFRQLQYLIDVVPSAVSSQLVIRLGRIALDPHSTDLWGHLRDLEDRMFHLGN